MNIEPIAGGGRAIHIDNPLGKGRIVINADGSIDTAGSHFVVRTPAIMTELPHAPPGTAAPQCPPPQVTERDRERRRVKKRRNLFLTALNAAHVSVFGSGCSTCGDSHIHTLLAMWLRCESWEQFVIQHTSSLRHWLVRKLPGLTTEQLEKYLNAMERVFTHAGDTSEGHDI